MACGYSTANLFIFLASLRATGFAGIIKLGIDPSQDHSTLAFLRRHNVQYDPTPCALIHDGSEEVPSHIRSVGSGDSDPGVSHDGVVLARAAAKRHAGNLNQLRYSCYLRWFREASYDRVWMLDVRDVYFQADPFANSRPELTFYTDTRWLLAFDTKRLRICLGEDVMERMAAEHKPNFCGGTVFGPAMAVQRFCEDMDALLRNVSGSAKEKNCWRNDQPFLNYFLSQQGLRSLGLHQHARYGPVRMFTAFEPGALALNIKAYNRVNKMCPYLEQVVITSGPASAPGGLRYIPGDDGSAIPILHKWGVCQTTRDIVGNATQMLQPQVHSASSAQPD